MDNDEVYWPRKKSTSGPSSSTVHKAANLTSNRLGMTVPWEMPRNPLIFNETFEHPRLNFRRIGTSILTYIVQYMWRVRHWQNTKNCRTIRFVSCTLAVLLKLCSLDWSCHHTLLQLIKSVCFCNYIFCFISCLFFSWYSFLWRFCTNTAENADGRWWWLFSQVNCSLQSFESYNGVIEK